MRLSHPLWCNEYTGKRGVGGRGEGERGGGRERGERRRGGGRGKGGRGEGGRGSGENSVNVSKLISSFSSCLSLPLPPSLPLHPSPSLSIPLPSSLSLPLPPSLSLPLDATSENGPRLHAHGQPWFRSVCILRREFPLPPLLPVTLHHPSTHRHTESQ